MKKVLPWIGLGLLAAAVGGTTFGCSSSSGGNGGTGGNGTGGGLVGGSGGTGGGTTGGTGGTTTTGGTGGAGGGTTTTTKLGATCTTDADCGTGLTCSLPTANGFGAGGPARGYCTKDCSANTDCTTIDPTAQCVNVGTTAAAKTVCLQGCSLTATTQCGGRYDSFCLPLSQTDADGGVVDSGTTIAACIPECASDADCGGRKCDLSNGLCVDTPKAGKAVGADCDPTATTDPCAGFCIGFQGQPQNVGTCTAFCNNTNLGQPGACGSDPTPSSPQAAACLFSATFNAGGSVGICGQLCNCDSDCLASGDVCQSWANGGASNPSQYLQIFHMAGACVPGTDADGGTVTGIPTCPGGGGAGGSGGTGGTGGTGGSSAGGSGGTATDAGAG